MNTRIDLRSLPKKRIDRKKRDCLILQNLTSVSSIEVKFSIAVTFICIKRVRAVETERSEFEVDLIRR